MTGRKEGRKRETFARRISSSGAKRIHGEKGNTVKQRKLEISWKRIGEKYGGTRRRGHGGGKATIVWTGGDGRTGRAQLAAPLSLVHARVVM